LKEPNFARRPPILLCGEMERLGPSMDALRGNLNILKPLALVGCEVGWLDAGDSPDQGDIVAAEAADIGSKRGAGEVFNRGSVGCGAGLGFKYLS
jgi:hypothetical protein